MPITPLDQPSPCKTIEYLLSRRSLFSTISMASRVMSVSSSFRSWLRSERTLAYFFAV